MAFTQQQIDNWIKQYPLLQDIVSLKPVFWQNPKLQRMAELPELPVSLADMEEAEALWQRFAPFIAKAFPETAEAEGIIESPLKPIPHMQAALEEKMGMPISGSLYLKCDNDLPIAGSVKARGGIYEVLQHAEEMALAAGLIQKSDNYELFASDAFRQFFSNYSMGVGSTGNLGLSIGIVGAVLGFQTTVYMSSDAKQWKKDLLRANGAHVLECQGDFGEAITRGREETKQNPNAYFVDDEKSKHLFLGYSVAAFRLKAQLEREGIQVDADHPLFVYLPCGVGGAPGGIAFGLKQMFGDAVHCFFAEPTHSPAVLIGLMTGEKEKVSVQDFGIDNRTEADGLAVGRPSSFASGISERLVSGVYTLEDDELFKGLAFLADSEDLFVEPSATAGFPGPVAVLKSGYPEKKGLDMSKAVHLAWATGGSLVPQADRERFYRKGKDLLR
ncbi:D-serine ammonia-lyase [Planococcus sp. FY231025]|uniref:D-serine ammonia-lyase n=1 Tax=Planococcus sp. FY231025 TaxID=3455699 RepID=UPI003F90D72F